MRDGPFPAVQDAGHDTAQDEHWSGTQPPGPGPMDYRVDWNSAGIQQSNAAAPGCRVSLAALGASVVAASHDSPNAVGAWGLFAEAALSTQLAGSPGPDAIFGVGQRGVDANPPRITPE